MNSNRLQKLQDYYKSDPNDPFIIYALALEYEKVDLAKAIELYETLLEKFPEYLPTYYQVAHIYWDQENEKARDVFLKGIEVAEKQNETKTLNELKSAFTNFQMENDY